MFALRAPKQSNFPQRCRGLYLWLPGNERQKKVFHPIPQRYLLCCKGFDLFSGLVTWFSVCFTTSIERNPFPVKKFIYRLLGRRHQLLFEYNVSPLRCFFLQIRAMAFGFMGHFQYTRINSCVLFVGLRFCLCRPRGAIRQKVSCVYVWIRWFCLIFT